MINNISKREEKNGKLIIILIILAILILGGIFLYVQMGEEKPFLKKGDKYVDVNFFSVRIKVPINFNKENG